MEGGGGGGVETGPSSPSSSSSSRNVCLGEFCRQHCCLQRILRAAGPEQQPGESGRSGCPNHTGTVRACTLSRSSAETVHHVNHQGFGVFFFLFQE